MLLYIIYNIIIYILGFFDRNNFYSIQYTGFVRLCKLMVNIKTFDINVIRKPLLGMLNTNMKELLHDSLLIQYKKSLYYKIGDSNMENIIFYIHGGGFVSGSYYSYYPLMKYISNKGLVIFPEYRLCPENTLHDSIDDCYNVFKKISKQYNNKKIIIMADSAGGFIAIELLKIINNIKKVILISPITRLTVDKVDDIMLNRDIVQFCMPKYNNNNNININNITIWVDRYELFYLHSLEFYKKYKKYINIRICEKYIHALPIYFNMIPEAKEELDLILQI